MEEIYKKISDSILERTTTTIKEIKKEDLESKKQNAEERIVIAQEMLDKINLQLAILNEE